MLVETSCTALIRQYTNVWHVQGATGFTGATGVKGLDGAMGDVGVIGITGPTGPIGYTGANNSVKGEVGVPGKNGSLGDDGATGRPGPQGQIGEQGPRGLAGKNYNVVLYGPYRYSPSTDDGESAINHLHCRLCISGKTGQFKTRCEIVTSLK